MKDVPFSAARMLELYDRISDAEDAIPRLRRFVLDLAVRGKLVEQDESDEPAAELLTRIAAEKAMLLKAKAMRKPKDTVPLEADDLPFALPSGWTWTQIAQLGVDLSRFSSGLFRAIFVMKEIRHDDKIHRRVSP